MRMVAKVAGVSVMSVSNVVNGRYHLLRPGTRARIDEAIAKTGYRPHAGAQSLRLSSSRTVGLLVIDQTSSFLSEPFIAQIASGLSATLGREHYGMLLQAAPRLDLEDAMVFQPGRTDGVCVFLEGSDSYRAKLIERLAALHQPVVAFQEVGLPPELGDVCAIRQRDKDGGRLIAEHVLSRGAQRFAVLIPSILRPGASQRLLGVKSGLADLGEEPHCHVLACGDMSFASTQAAVSGYLEGHPLPDAFIALNDHMGIATMKLLRARGFEIPADVMVTGYNGMEYLQYADPLLTTVRSQAYQMGATAARTMLQRLDTGSFPEREIVLPVELSIGQST